MLGFAWFCCVSGLVWRLLSGGLICASGCIESVVWGSVGTVCGVVGMLEGITVSWLTSSSVVFFNKSYLVYCVYCFLGAIVDRKLLPSVQTASSLLGEQTSVTTTNRYEYPVVVPMSGHSLLYCIRILILLIKQPPSPASRFSVAAEIARCSYIEGAE